MIRTGMNREERAKQFIPFSPLKGYEEALREKERTIVPRIWSIRPLGSRRNVQSKAGDRKTTVEQQEENGDRGRRRGADRK